MDRVELASLFKIGLLKLEDDVARHSSAKETTSRISSN